MESEIIAWANRRLEESGKGVKIKHFQVKIVYHINLKPKNLVKRTWTHNELILPGFSQ